MKPLLEQLEQTMVKYSDLKTVPARDNGEKLITLDALGIPNKYPSDLQDMIGVADGKILVRDSVGKRLLIAQKLLQDENQQLSVFVTYGYRTIAIQTERFLKVLRTINKFFPDEVNLYEEAHRFVAVPTVAGHPTGGAVDIAIINRETYQFLEFGSKQYNYTTKDCYVFSPNISKQARINRMILRSVMIKTGFAPFDGEWWHFSYGDREWAFFYKKKAAIYDQISTNSRILKSNRESI